jgi:hypothetical protein
VNDCDCRYDCNQGYIMTYFVYLFIVRLCVLAAADCMAPNNRIIVGNELERACKKAVVA